MLELHQWIILLLIGAFVAQDTTAGPQLLFSEPLVAGPLVGLLLGDFKVGLLIGIATQLIWSGAVPAGSSLFLDVNVGSVCTVAVAIIGGKTLLAMAGALLWMIPVGLLGCGLTDLNRRFNDRIVLSVRPERERGRLIGIRHLTGWLLAGLRGMVTTAAGVPLGAAVVPSLTVWAGPFVRPEVLWSGILGAGAGVALGVTWRHSHGRAALVGAMTAIGFWLIGVRPGW